MATKSERLRGCGPLQGDGNVRRTCDESADTIDALLRIMRQRRFVSIVGPGVAMSSATAAT